MLTSRFQGRDFRLTDVQRKIVKEIRASRTALTGFSPKGANYRSKATL